MGVRGLDWPERASTSLLSLEGSFKRDYYVNVRCDQL